MAKLTLTNLAGGYLSAAAINANNTLTEAAMENTLSRDGTTPNVMNANIDMNSTGRLVNLVDAVNNQEPVTLAQAALIAGVTNALTQDTVGAVLWPQHAVETARSITAVNLEFYYGDVMRYDAKIDGSTDDTAAFNSAVDSGWPAFCNMAGNAAIEGTIALGGNAGTGTAKVLTLNPALRLQRYTDVDIPMVQVWGLFNYFNGKMGQLAHKTHTYTNGILLLGPSPTGAYTDADHGVSTQNNVITALRIIGHQKTIVGDGSPGIYIHSAGRKRGNFLGDTTYYNSLSDIGITQCDVGIEHSTDANANSLVGITILDFNTCAIQMNASYGNQYTALKIEKGVVVTGSPTRAAIRCGQMNEGQETDTDLAYPIGAAQDNYFNGFIEVHNNTDQVITVMTFSAGNSTGANTSGNNEFHMFGTYPAGFGKLGGTTELDIGPNRINCDIAMKDYTDRPVHFHDFMIRPLDDDTGSTLGSLSWKVISGNARDVAESTQKDLFVIDNIGPGAAGFLIKLMYSGKADAISTVQMGEILYACWIEGASTKEGNIISQVSTSFADTRIFDFNYTLAAGTAANSMKVTVGFLTVAPAGTNEMFCAWKAELMSTNLEETNVDYDADITIL